MRNKQKQKVNLSVILPPDDAYDDTMNYDASYFADLAKNKHQGKQKVAPIAQEARQETAEREQKIRNLYPDYYEREILLSQLVKAPREWNFFPKWDRQMMAELMENISVYGQLSPALVWEQDDGTYMILGGHNRYQAIKNLHDLLQKDYPEEAEHYTKMRCNVYAHDTLDEVEARKIIIFDNTIRRANSKAIMRRSIINMNQLMKDTRASRRPDTKRKRIRDQIAETMNISPRTVMSIVSLRNLIPAFWPLFDEKDKAKKLSDKLGQAISYLPEQLQKYIYDNGLYANAHLTSEQLKKLRTAKSVEDVQEAFTAPQEYVLTTQIKSRTPLPTDYKLRALPLRDDEVEIVQKALQNSNLSAQTKALIQRFFSPGELGATVAPNSKNAKK